MLRRIEQIRIIIQKQNLDALFVTGQHNVTYLTNFAGLSPNEKEGFLLITKIHAYLLTFPTYFELYKDHGRGFDVLNITFKKRLHQHLTEIIKKEKIKIIGIEKDNLTLSEFDQLKNKLKVKFVATAGIVENLRLIKDEIEIAYIKKAAKITDQAFDFIRNKITKGISEKNLAVELEFFIKKNADDIAFAPIVAFNQNAAVPHYLPNNRQHLADNSLILLDFGARVAGYCSDMTRVVFFGKPSQKWIALYNTVLQAQKLALKKIKVGLICGVLDKSIKKFLNSKGYPEYEHGLGHGVGLTIHEAPRLKIGSNKVLQENMIITVEPGIYIPDKYGIRIEDLVVLRKSGIEILSKSPKLLKELII